MFAETAGENKSGGKGSRVLAIISGLSFIVGLILLSPSFTGNVIGSLNKSSSTILGIVLVALGILGFWFFSKLMNSYL